MEHDACELVQYMRTSVILSVQKLSRARLTAYSSDDLATTVVNLLTEKQAMEVSTADLATMLQPYVHKTLKASDSLVRRGDLEYAYVWVGGRQEYISVFYVCEHKGGSREEENEQVDQRDERGHHEADARLGHGGAKEGPLCAADCGRPPAGDKEVQGVWSIPSCRQGIWHSPLRIWHSQLRIWHSQLRCVRMRDYCLAGATPPASHCRAEALRASEARGA